MVFFFFIFCVCMCFVSLCIFATSAIEIFPLMVKRINRNRTRPLWGCLRPTINTIQWLLVFSTTISITVNHCYFFLFYHCKNELHTHTFVFDFFFLISWFGLLTQIVECGACGKCTSVKSIVKQHINLQTDSGWSPTHLVPSCSKYIFHCWDSSGNKSLG